MRPTAACATQERHRGKRKERNRPARVTRGATRQRGIVSANTHSQVMGIEGVRGYSSTRKSTHLLPGDGDHVAQLSRLAVHLDAVVQELLERGGVKDAVLDRDVAVDDILEGLLLGRLLRLGLEKRDQTRQANFGGSRAGRGQIRTDGAKEQAIDPSEGQSASSNAT